MREVVAVGRAHGVDLRRGLRGSAPQAGRRRVPRHDLLDAPRPRARQPARSAMARRRRRGTGRGPRACPRRSTAPSPTSWRCTRPGYPRERLSPRRRLRLPRRSATAWRPAPSSCTAAIAGGASARRGASFALNAMIEADRVHAPRRRAGDRRHAVGERQGPEDRALPPLPHRPVEQLRRRRARGALRPRRHARRSGPACRPTSTSSRPRSSPGSSSRPARRPCRSTTTARSTGRAESLARRQALLPRIEAYQASLRAGR